MKQFSHAWLAFKAIERLEKADLSTYRQDADTMIRWFWSYRDGVICGSWYPDMVIKDMATSHVYKHNPDPKGTTEFMDLPNTCQALAAGKRSALYKQPYVVADSSNNLPERCEALSHSIIDNLKMQETEEKGSPIAPTDNHIATRMFMLSHYIADAHMPLHCDSRQFSNGADVHARIEDAWDKEISKHYRIDLLNERFYYNPYGYPLRAQTDYTNSFLKKLDEGLSTLPFSIEYGGKNTNVRTYMQAVCQYSYLLSYAFIPQGNDDKNVTVSNWRMLPGQTIDFEQLSLIVFTDAIDAIARVWLRVWRRYLEWKKN
jgi:hypothetical protein